MSDMANASNSLQLINTIEITKPARLLWKWYTDTVGGKISLKLFQKCPQRYNNNHKIIFTHDTLSKDVL